MFLLPYYPPPFANFEYILWLTINYPTHLQENSITTKTAGITNTISGVGGGCGGGGRNFSRCTTAAIIFIFKNSTNNNKNILKAPSILPKEYRKGQDIFCNVIVRLRHNLSSYDCEIIVKVAIVVCIIAVQIKTIELQTTISTKGTNNIFNMISPASTCMGTIHKYYEKIKDATEERKP